MLGADELGNGGGGGAAEEGNGGGPSVGTCGRLWGLVDGTAGDDCVGKGGGGGAPGIGGAAAIGICGVCDGVLRGLLDGIDGAEPIGNGGALPGIGGADPAGIGGALCAGSFLCGLFVGIEGADGGVGAIVLESPRCFNFGMPPAKISPNC